MNIVVTNIEFIRKSKGVTKTHIAKHCKKTSAWYGDITRGKNRLSVDDFLLVADALKVKPETFFNEELSVSRNFDDSA